MAGKGRRWSFPFGIRHLFRCFSCSFSGSVLSFVAKKNHLWELSTLRPLRMEIWNWPCSLSWRSWRHSTFLCGIWTLNHDRFEQKSQAISFCWGGGSGVGRSILSGTPKGSSESHKDLPFDHLKRACHQTIWLYNSIENASPTHSCEWPATGDHGAVGASCPHQSRLQARFGQKLADGWCLPCFILSHVW